MSKRASLLQFFAGKLTFWEHPTLCFRRSVRSWSLAHLFRCGTRWMNRTPFPGESAVHAGLETRWWGLGLLRTPCDARAALCTAMGDDLSGGTRMASVLLHPPPTRNRAVRIGTNCMVYHASNRNNLARRTVWFGFSMRPFKDEIHCD